MFIDDPGKWRMSKSGFSIVTGWSTERRMVAGYPYVVNPLDTDKYQLWLKEAELIVELYNKELPRRGMASDSELDKHQEM